jgi:hypothetical protein
VLWIVICFTTGGLNAILGAFGFTLFRTGCRYSIVILAIALMYAAEWLSGRQRQAEAKMPADTLRIGVLTAVVGLCLLILWDQVPRTPTAEQTATIARQVEAGADALMLFDSWAEGLPDNIFREVVIAPTKKLVARLREMGITVPVIGFPRGAGVMLPEYVRETGVTAVGLDTAVSPAFINSELPAGFPVQGHLDPLLLIEGGGRLDARVRQLLDAYKGRPHIFNLGHGVRPETPIAYVERVLNLIRNE